MPQTVTTIHDMSTAQRGVLYPKRHLGSLLEQHVEATIDSSAGLDSMSAVARWLGFERSKFHGWVKGRVLPAQDEDLERLTKLGLSEKEIREAILMDRLDAFAIDAGLEPEELVRLTADVARAAGLSVEELVEEIRGREEAEERGSP